MQNGCAIRIVENTVHNTEPLTQNEAAKALQTKADSLVTTCLALERLASEFLRAVDESTTLISEHTCCEIEEIDPIKTFGCMRNILKPSLAVKDTIRTFSETWSTKFDHFDEKIDELQQRINRSAMHCGLKRIPDELLSEILKDAVIWFGSLVTLSHVCKRFRSIIIGTRKLWRGYRLLSSDTPDTILTIAERCGFQSLKAFIREESLCDSAKTILDLHGRLEKLDIYSLSKSIVLAMQQHLKDLSFPDLRRLVILCNKHTDRDSIPALEFPGPCYMPHLWDLDIGFIPHPSLARNLTEFTLYPDSEYCLRDLLEFLKSTTILQELVVYFNVQFADQEDARVLDPISLQHLVQLRILGITAASVVSACTLTEKILPVEKLGLHTRDFDIGIYLTSIQTNMSIRELSLEQYSEPIINFGRILSLLPRRTEVLECDFQFSKIVFEVSDHEEFKAHRLRTIRFKYSLRLSITLILSLRDFLISASRDTVRIEFQGCHFGEDGTYTLNELNQRFGRD